MSGKVLLAGAAIALIFSLSVSAGETLATYPQWDGQEPAAAYAQRMGLHPQQRLELGGGVGVDLKLIPAGTFRMGSEAPPELNALSFKRAYLIGLAGLLVAAAGIAIARRSKRGVAVIALAGAALVLMAAAGGGWLSVRKQLKEAAEAREEYDLIGESEKPPHTVVISAPFYMSACEITQEQYQAVMGANPSTFKGPKNPVETLTWRDAVKFCEALSANTGLKVRLPSEAQWEYACRAGTTSPVNTGGRLLSGTEANVELQQTVPVGSFPPNAFGLFDMHGNVWEWCQDAYGEHYYASSPERDPSGPEKSDVAPDARVLRGGSYGGDPDFYRSAARRWLPSDNSNNDIGFRVVVLMGVAQK